MAGVPLSDVVAYLDGYLKIADVPDEPNAVNGLQVENRSGAVWRIIAAVDASLETIEGVDRRTGGPADAGLPAGGILLLVHHGLFWDGNVPVTGRRYKRLRALLDRDAALYSAHIPLDLHPEVGNNAVLARMLDLADPAPFDLYRGISIGVQGRAPRGTTREHLVERINRVLATEARLIPGGPEPVSRVGVVTGGAGSSVRAAREAGLDTFVTGEGAHHTYFDAMELGVNLIYAGHYATEQLGVQSLAEHVGLRFRLPVEFHRHPTGM